MLLHRHWAESSHCFWLLCIVSLFIGPSWIFIPVLRLCSWKWSGSIPYFCWLTEIKCSFFWGKTPLKPPIFLCSIRKGLKKCSNARLPPSPYSKTQQFSICFFFQFRPYPKSRSSHRYSWAGCWAWPQLTASEGKRVSLGKSFRWKPLFSPLFVPWIVFPRKRNPIFSSTVLHLI